MSAVSLQAVFYGKSQSGVQEKVTTEYDQIHRKRLLLRVLRLDGRDLQFDAELLHPRQGVLIDVLTVSPNRACSQREFRCVDIGIHQLFPGSIGSKVHCGRAVFFVVDLSLRLSLLFLTKT